MNEYLEYIAVGGIVGIFATSVAGVSYMAYQARRISKQVSKIGEQLQEINNQLIGMEGDRINRNVNQILCNVLEFKQAYRDRGRKEDDARSLEKK